MPAETIRLLSFDPGLSTTGWNVSDYNMKEHVMRVIGFGMLTPNKNVNLSEMQDDTVKYGQRIMTLMELRKQVRELMIQYTPDIIVSEDAFYNPLRPAAYCALLQWITTLELLLHDEFQKVLFKIAPRMAKQVVSGFGDASKRGVQYAILHKQEIQFKHKHVEERLTEHICDSIGIGYTFLQEIFPALFDIWRYGYSRKPGEQLPTIQATRSYFC